MDLYNNEIIDVGKYTKDMIKENLMILFNQNVTKDLEPYCFIVKENISCDVLDDATKLIIGENEFKITAIGSYVRKNLENLGHITICFNGATKASMLGTLYVEGSIDFDIKVGSRIVIQ